MAQKKQQQWVLRTEGGEEGDFETVHTSEISAYIDAASLLREDWSNFFTEPCPINYRGTERQFIDSVKEAAETWKAFRNDEGAFDNILKDDAPSTKWSPYSYEVKKAETIRDNKFVEAQKQWAKEDGLKPSKPLKAQKS